MTSASSWTAAPPWPGRRSWTARLGRRSRRESNAAAYCSVLMLSSLPRAPRDFQVGTPALPASPADVGFVGEVQDPLRVSLSPCRHTRLLNSFRAVDAVLLALHGDECLPAAAALARSEPVTHLRQHVHRIDDAPIGWRLRLEPSSQWPVEALGSGKQHLRPPELMLPRLLLAKRLEAFLDVSLDGP